MRKTEIVAGGLFALLGAVFFAGAIVYGVGSPTSDGQPGAGFFPVIVSSIVLLLGLGLILKAATNPDRQSPFFLEEEQKANPRPLYLTLAGLAGLFLLWVFAPLRLLNPVARRLLDSDAFLFQDYAFEFAALLFSVFMNRVYGRGWLFSWAFAIAFVAVVYFCFTKMLYIQFII